MKTSQVAISQRGRWRLFEVQRQQRGSPSLGVLVRSTGPLMSTVIVNANQYACQGIVLTPAFETMERIFCVRCKQRKASSW